MADSNNSEDYKLSNWAIHTQFDIVEGGYNEDGELEHFDVWYVVAGHKDGRRFVYRDSFKDYNIQLVKAEVEELASFIKDRFDEEAPLRDPERNIDRQPRWTLTTISNSQSWRETFPVYGSKAYQTRGGEEELIEFERSCEL